ncbi:hypothetical protein [Kitasatospora sp. NBC_01302]|uniref:hypothetical protein n=1 Tax=Kitasatospora sp. NBC_01302 TaxID=2903575 RepID=UPI002E12CD1A|nr:hypothetical protein OG294_14370 [Kitasatospora sp. NBC_01302]
MPHPLEPYARLAFAAGFATADAPITERFQMACATAVQLAVERRNDPLVLEATVELGRLEGMWAQLFARRDHLITRYTGSVSDAWRRLIRPRALRDPLHNFHADLGPRDQEPDRTTVEAAASAAARAILQALPLTAGWAAMRAAIRDALAAGRAEGIVDAVAIAAARARRDGLNWDAAFDRAYQQLERLGDLWGEADEWAGRIAARAEADLRRLLVAKAAEGGGFEDTLDAVTDHLTGEKIAAVGFGIDWAMTASAVQAALGLYQAQGAQTIDWITVGDGRVCPTCESNEDASPWPIDQVPEAPAHPMCRCVLSADIDPDRLDRWFTT